MSIGPMTPPTRPRCTLILIADGPPPRPPGWAYHERFRPANNRVLWDGLRVIDDWPCGGGRRVIRKATPMEG